MKKNTFVKILASIVVLAAIIAGAFVIYKNFFAIDEDDDFDNDDFEDDFDSEEIKREYVSIPYEENASADSVADAVELPAEDDSDLTE